MLIGLLRRVFLRATHWPIFASWLLFFTFSGLSALCLQLLVLPLLFPDLHAGNGLLLGTDSVGFHKIGVVLSQKVLSQGWGAWELAPLGHPPAGIAAAFYALTVSQPYALIPLNAALHATAGTMLIQIARMLTADYRIAFYASLPFIVFPSSMQWYAQIGKDGFYFAGAFFCLYGWIILARFSTWQFGVLKILTGFLWLFMGLVLMGSVRVYSFQLMQGIGAIFAIALTIIFLKRGAEGVLPWRTCSLAIISLFFVPLLLKFAPVETRGTSEIPQPGVAIGSAWHGSDFARDKWRPTAWSPRVIDNSFLKIAVLRNGYLFTPGYQGSLSMVDRSIELLSILDFLSYLPRALQLGLFAPFPTEWIGSNPAGPSSIMVSVASCEMVVVYLALIFLPYTIWLFRFKVELWLTLCFGGIILLIYSYATPNIGSLYRLRYGFLMLLVTLGLVGAIGAWRKIFILYKSSS